MFRNNLSGNLQSPNLPFSKAFRKQKMSACFDLFVNLRNVGCNQYKWTKTEAQDPETGEDVKIFNPRQQKWIDHFAWNSEGTQIIGLTAVGRATIAALQLNNSLAVIVRSNWVKAGWHPPSFD
jgi:hypothetical protein